MFPLRKIIRLPALSYNRVHHIIYALKTDRVLRDLVFPKEKTFNKFNEEKINSRLLNHPKIKEDRYNRPDELFYAKQTAKEVLVKNLKMKILGENEKFYPYEFRSTFRVIIPRNRVKIRV